MGNKAVASINSIFYVRTKHITYESICGELGYGRKVELRLHKCYWTMSWTYLKPLLWFVIYIYIYIYIYVYIYIYNGVYIFFYCSFITLSYHLHLINETWMRCVSAWISKEMAFDVSVYSMYFVQVSSNWEPWLRASLVFYECWRMNLRVLIFRNVSSIAFMYPRV